MDLRFVRIGFLVISALLGSQIIGVQVGWPAWLRLLLGAASGAVLVLLEAASVGLPVVGCATGGVEEAVGPGLLLSWPDDPVRSAEEVRAWWSPERGMAAREWVSAHHGVHRTVAALTAMR